MEESYTGYKEIELNDEKLSDFYSKQILLANLEDNEYLILKHEGKVIDYYRARSNQLTKLEYPTISNKFEDCIKPRNPQQYCAMDLLLDRESKIKILRGVYGSGKDYLMFHAAMEQIEKGNFEKIIFTRPPVGIGDLPDIGALPGTADEKLSWTLAPLYDKVSDEEGIKFLVERQQLKMVPMNFIRGRSFNNSIVYVTEGQNMTTELVKLLIGRIGEGSELWINADNHQVDKRIYEKDNGINRAIERLSGNRLFGYVYLPITERSEVARLADLLD